MKLFLISCDYRIEFYVYLIDSLHSDCIIRAFIFSLHSLRIYTSGDICIRLKVRNFPDSDTSSLLSISTQNVQLHRLTLVRDRGAT